MNISILSPTFVWDTRNVIIPVTTLAIPLAIEGIHLAVEVYRNPSCIKDNLLKVWSNLTRDFVKNPGEKDEEYKRRFIKNAVCVQLQALLIIGGGSAAYFLAPPSVSIAAALIAIQVVGKILEGLDQVPQLSRRVVDYLADAFHQKENETPESLYQRRFEAIKKITACTLVFTASVAVICGMGYVGSLLANAKSVWQLSEALPFQTPTVVFLEYATLGVAHAALSAHAWRKGNHSAALFHLMSAITAVAFPVRYIMEGGEVRLHHSFIGLALQLAPWRPVQCLGSVITFDSFLNNYLGAQGIDRGEIVHDVLRGNIVHQYDYQNALVENLPFAVTALSSVCLLGRNLDYLTGRKNNIDGKE